MSADKIEKVKIKTPWYFSWWTILTLILAGIITVGLTSIIGFILLFGRFYYMKSEKLKLQVSEVKNLQEEITSLKTELNNLEIEHNQIQVNISNSLNIFEENKASYIEQIRAEYESEGKRIIDEIILNNQKKIAELQKFAEERDELSIENEKLSKNIKSQSTKLSKLKTEFNGIRNLIDLFPQLFNEDNLPNELELLLANYDEESIMKSLVELDYHAMNSKELRKQINKIKKEIATLLDKYKDRYKTKANQAIYQLMVIGLQAELQNILYTLSYAKHEEAIDNAKALIRKYLAISTNGNASISPTISKFLAELEPLFIEAIEVEYQYYIKREQEKEEQRLIREQMRQEAAERKELEAQKKKLEAEEAKFEVELQRTNELLISETNPDIIAQLQSRISELEQQQNNVVEQKEEIFKRANGKAGYVYAISNLGSFGKQVFKVGMTRRMNPQDRVDELGDASVPFKFDVHAMIFSDDAVGLEYQLHQELSDKRLNKVNLRKEFFVTTVKELQTLVETIDPTAEFKTTMVAHEYFRSIEMDEVGIIPTSSLPFDSDEVEVNEPILN
ncbi:MULTISPECIES: GIY-YIG nuclease family protein [unclassified Exiguobacterium]|uniref:GIY-YIG nuclease family protein n=1 Tax=unclassified Exiguobacterium TaxID=2644629 RepID=UPI001BEB3A6C|nr:MULTISPECIES: GIY-YIG nuclease family protein [unclassified Exiguobacterium]